MRRAIVAVACAVVLVGSAFAAEPPAGETLAKFRTERVEALKSLTPVNGMGDDGVQLFENLPELLTPEIAARALQTTRGTVYQWHYRPKKYDITDGLFLKLGRKLLIRREVLKTWVLSRNRNGRNQ